MADHTPAPWRIRWPSDWTSDQRTIVKDDPLANRGYFCIAWVGPTTSSTIKDRDIAARHDANARLIARSPSMLALLENLLPLIEAEAERRGAALTPYTEAAETDPYWTEMQVAANQISAEIDKARGKGVSDD